MAQDWTGGLTPGTIGLGWFPNQIGGTALSPSRGCAIQFTSTATETINNAWVGFDTVSTTGRFMLDVYTAGSEVPSGLATASFVPTADEVNTSNLWQNQAGATSNLYQSIDNGVVNPASYVTYQGTFTQKGTYAFNIGSGAWPSGRRVLKMSFTFTGAATNNAVGRVQVVYRGSAINYVLGTCTLTGTQESFTYELGELNPDTGLPWTEADVDALASSAGFGWRALSGATTGMEIYDASVTITYCTENRLAAGMELVSSFSAGPQWVTFNLFNPNTGAANWSKANATDYSFVVRPLSPDGAPPGVFTAGTGSARTLDSGAPLPTGAVGYRPLLDSSGAVVSMGDDFTFGMSLALDVNASATDSGDGQPYTTIGQDVGGAGSGGYQEVNGAAAGTYELMRASVAVTLDADDSDTLYWEIVNPTGPVTLDSGTLTAAQIREGELLISTSDLREFYLIEVPVSVVLASATTYRIGWTGTADATGMGILSTTGQDGSGGTATHGNPATYGGTTLDWFGNADQDLPVTVSTIPDPVTGFQTWQESWDTGQSGCNPTQVPYTVLRWNAASLGDDFGYYQIERSIDGGDWTQVAQITSEDVERYEDKEAPFGAEVTYRISVVRTGDLIPSEWTEVEAQTLTAPECVWYFSSNLYEDILAYNAGDRTTWTFPSSDFVEISRRAGVNYQQALIASEWLGDVFELDLTTWLPPNPATPSPVGEGRATFDPILDMTRAALPYICVRDWRGRVWYSNVNVTEGRDDNSGASPHDVASAVITELTDTPAIIDVEANVLDIADAWWNAEQWDGTSDLLDITANGNDGTPQDPAEGPPILCTYDDTQWAFFPGWEDEGASTDGITPTGTLDIRWDSEPLPIDVGVVDYWPVHLGSDADELGFTVRQEIGTGELELRFSTDGTTAVVATATAAPSGADSGQRRITRNPTTGDVTFYERTSGVLTSNTGWVQIGTVVAAATGAINADVTQSLAISGPTTGAQWDGVGQNFGGRLNRLIVSDGTGILADFDPDLATRPFATFTGGAAETWTFHRAASTGSYRVDIVDRTSVALGNAANFTMGDVLDAGTGPVTVVHAFWHQVQTPALQGLIGKNNTDFDPTSAGYGLLQADNLGGGPGTGGLLGAAADGADTAVSLAAGTPEPAMGTVSVVAMVLDRDADTITTYVDGTSATPASTAAVGDTGNAEPFRIGLVENVSSQMWLGSAVFLRALTSATIESVATADIAEYPPIYTPFLFVP